MLDKRTSKVLAVPALALFVIAATTTIRWTDIRDRPAYLSSSYTSLSSACTAAASQTLIIDKEWTSLSTMTCAANLQFTPSGSLKPSSGQTVTLSGTVQAAPYKIFDLSASGAIAFGSAVTEAPVEWFGAVGNGSTDDAGAIQGTINALSAGAALFLPRNYKIGSALSITTSHVHLIGSAGSAESTQLETSSASIDMVDLAGTSTAAQINQNTIRDINFIRTAAPSGSAKCISSVYTANNILKNVVCANSVYGFYFAGTNNFRTDRSWAEWGTNSVTISSGSLYGFYSDTGSHPNQSAMLSDSFAVSFSGASGATTYGLYATGDTIQDLYVDHLETATVSYGAYIVSSNSDHDWNIHLSHNVHDSYTVAGVYVSGLGSSGQLVIDDGWFNAGTTGTTTYGVEVTGTSSGVAVTNSQFLGGGNNATNVGVYFDGCVRCVIANNLIRNGVNGIFLNSSQLSSVSNNSIFGDDSGNAVSPGIKSVGSTRVTYTGNTLDCNPGTCGVGISLDSSSNDNVVKGNSCNTGSITTCYANAGARNDIDFSGVGSPETHTASTSGELDFTSCISPNFSAYEIQLIDVVAASTGIPLNIQVSTDGGANYDTTGGHYLWQLSTFTGGPAGSSGSDSKMELVTNNGGGHVSGFIKFMGPGGSGTSKTFIGETTNSDTGWSFMGMYTQSTPFNAFRIISNSGNLTSGTVTCRGIPQ